MSPQSTATTPKARSNIRVSRAHLLRMRELAQEFGCLSMNSLHPELKPSPTAALVRAIADGEIELRRVRQPKGESSR